MRTIICLLLIFLSLPSLALEKKDCVQLWLLCDVTVTANGITANLEGLESHIKGMVATPYPIDKLPSVVLVCVLFDKYEIAKIGKTSIQIIEQDILDQMAEYLKIYGFKREYFEYIH